MLRPTTTNSVRKLHCIFMKSIRQKAKIFKRHSETAIMLAMNARGWLVPFTLYIKSGKYEAGLGYDLSALNNSVGQHGIGNFDEATDVGSLDVVDEAVRLPAILHASGVNLSHDVVQSPVDFFARPSDT